MASGVGRQAEGGAPCHQAIDSGPAFPVGNMDAH